MTTIQGEKGLFYAVRGTAEKVMTPVAEHLPHPNIITGRWRTAAAAAGLLTHAVSPITGSVCYAVNGVFDWFDGMSARVNNLRTREGERLDPYVDKVINAAYLVYIAARGIAGAAFDVAAAANIAVDLYSQTSRGSLIEQTREAFRATLHPETCTPIDPAEKVNAMKANFLGKLKFLLQNLSILSMLATGGNDVVEYAATVALCISALLGFISTMKRNALKRAQAEPAPEENTMTPS